jgi:3-oxoacyl-[acyl-carrier-protein] synthase II
VLRIAAARKPGGVEASLARMWDRIAAPAIPDQAAIISGATGAEPATGEERAFLEHPDVPVRAPGPISGMAMEAQFPMNVALAAWR